MLEQLVQLRQILVERFSDDELRTLCFDLGVDYADLPAEGKAGKARELVAHLDRHDQMPELLQVGQRMRPDVNWAQAYLDDRMTDLRDRRDQADQVRREWRERQRVINLRPLDVTHSFKDRGRETRELCAHLSEGGVRLVSIVGRGGMGKTALVSRVLADLERGVLPVPTEELEVDGILYLSARSTGLSLERIYSDVGRMLGESTAAKLAARWASGDVSMTAKVEYLLETMQNGSYLILLDNLEDRLTDDGRIAEEGLRLFVEHCLTQPGGARLITTSREQVQLAPAALRNVRHISLREGLPEAEAVALLRELDPQRTLGLADAPEDDLRRAAQLTQGIPRALEILAGILHADPSASLRQLLADERLFSKQVVEELIATGYLRLGAGERRVIEAMAVFDCPVEETAIAYLLHPWCPDLNLRVCLRHLATGYFVSVNRVTGEYSLHPLDREYAYQHLPGSDNLNAYTQRNLELRAADFYVSIRKSRDEWKTTDDLVPQLAEFDHRVHAGDYDNACQVLNLIDRDYLNKWGYYARLIEMREKLLDHLQDDDLRANNLGRLGNLYQTTGKRQLAIQFFRVALPISRRVGNRRDEGFWLGHLGSIYRAAGQVQRALVLHEHALHLHREIEDRPRQASDLDDLGLVYHALGQTSRAIQCYEEALTLARESGFQHEQSLWLTHLGIACHALGQTARATQLLEEALGIARKTGARRHEVVALDNLGITHFALGQIDRAIQLHQESLRIAREIGYRQGECYQLLRLGKAFLSISDLVQAHQYCMQALALSVPAINYHAALLRGMILLHQNDPVAMQAFSDAIRYCQAMLSRTAGLHGPHYAMATALAGQAVCDRQWVDKSRRSALLGPVLEECRRAIEISSAPGVVADALSDLELIRVASVEGLEPVFDLLKSVLK